MASTIDPTIWDVTGDIAKSTIKEKLATAAKNDIEALQTTVEGLTGDAVVMPESTIRGRLSAGTGAAENLTPEEVMSLLGLGDGAGATPDGRTILEAGSITDASAEFLSGATFTLDPTNARHYNIQVGDSTTPLTAAMTIDLVPDSTLWPATAQVIVTKGDASTYSITISGLNADGLGTATLVDQYEGVILGYHHTDGDNGPGAGGQKWKIVARFTRARRTDVQSVIDAGGYLQHGDVFPAPGLVESVAGAFVLDWETDFDGPRIVKLVRAAGDVSESLLATLPEIPSGHWATIRITESMTFQAPSRTFVLAASWTDTLGVGTITVTESGVTTATLGLAAGDVVSGGPFGSQTTIATIESDSVFTTTDPCGGTSSGTINIVAPAYSIDGNRLLGSPAMGPSGVLMQFTVMAPSTPTTRGEVKTPERVGAEAAGVSYDPSASALTANQVQAAIDELKVGIDGLSTAIDDLPIGAISTSRGFTFPAPSANVVTLTLDDLASDVSGSVIYERIRGILNDSPSTAIRVDLPIEAVAGDAVLLYHDETQAGTVTIQNVGAVGSVNGEASLASNGPGAFVLLVCKSNAGSAPTWRTGGIRELVQVLIRGYCEAVNTATVSSSAAITFTYTSQNANIIEYTLGADPASFAISGVPSGRAFALMVKIKMDATGGRTWPHPSGCLFAEGTAPTIDTSSNGITWLTYLVTPNGTFCFEGGKAWAVA